MKNILLTVLAVTACASVSQACYSAVSQRTLFVVNQPLPQPLNVQDEDLVEMNTVVGPQLQVDKVVVTVTPKIAISYQVPDGRIQFKILKEGQAELSVKVLDASGKVLKQITQKVDAKLRPRTRCG
jgi:hypothetical protein